MVFFHHGALTAGKWKDKRDVYFLSTVYYDEMETITWRGRGDTESVNKPKIVTNMSGVDIADQLMVYYACWRRTLKWYKRVFWRLSMYLSMPTYSSKKWGNQTSDSGHRSSGWS